jgi:hypothetical protein
MTKKLKVPISEIKKLFAVYDKAKAAYEVEQREYESLCDKLRAAETEMFAAMASGKGRDIKRVVTAFAEAYAAKQTNQNSMGCYWAVTKARNDLMRAVGCGAEEG